MPNTEPLEPRQQLRFILNRLTLRAPERVGQVDVLDAPSLRPEDTRVRPGGEVPLVQTVPVELTSHMLRDERGAEFLGWVYEGLLYVDNTDLEFAGGISGLPGWLREQLGEHALRVIVHDRDGNAVRARVEIRI